MTFMNKELETFIFDKIIPSTQNGSYHKFINKKLIKLNGFNKTKLVLFAEFNYFLNFQKDSTIIVRSLLLSLLYSVYFGIPLLLSFGIEIFSFSSSSQNLIPVKILPFVYYFLTTSIAIYWNLRNKFGSQWRYCANLYNKISMDIIFNKTPINTIYSRLTLSLDILQLNLHNHKSFKITFQISLLQALHYKFLKESTRKFPTREGDTGIFISNNWTEYVYREFNLFINNEKSFDDANALISEMQNDLDCLILRQVQGMNEIKEIA